MKGLKVYVVVLLLSGTGSLFAQQSVLTQHNDLYRTGWNKNEVILTNKNVKPGSFGLIFSRAVDDQIYAQPLVMLNVPIAGIGTKNIVFVATVNNSVYAFDADSANVTSPYWQINLSPSGTRAVKNTDMTGACGGGYRDFSGNMGIVSTPVIDSATNTIYVVARSVSTSTPLTFKQYLHALDLTTGVERPNSPKLITAQVSGNGDGSVAGKVNFDPQKQNQRSGLLLLNGLVYLTWASHCDWGPYHGWIMGYDKATLQQKIVFNTTPEGYNGGIWMSGAAPAADESGNIYVAVGNGSGPGSSPVNSRNHSESALKLKPSGDSLLVSSFFAPQNFNALEASDLDFGVTEVLLLPGTNRAMTGCKDGNLYLLDRDNMGGFSLGGNNVVQPINLGTNAHLRSSLAYYKGQQKEFVYSWSENALLQAFPYNRTTNQFDLGSKISSGVQGPVGNNGALLSVSSHGSIDSTAVLWTSYASNGDANQSVRPGILRAFDATDVTKELWNSAEYPNDNPGNYAKFNCPTVSNGKVYLATFSNKLVVYGLIKGAAADTCNSTNAALNKASVASSQGTNLPSNLAFDGDPATRWSSLFSDPQWISVDLGKRYDLCKVVLKWEAAFGQDFKIQGSDDNANWSTLITITGNTSIVNYLPIAGSARYVRMYGTARGTTFGYSLWEFEVYGSQSLNQCAEPSGLLVSDIYENSAMLHWNANGATQFVVQYKTVSAGSWIQTTSASNQLTIGGLACGTDYLYRIQGVCSASDSSKYSISSSFSTLSCNTNCSPLPTRWTTMDIGDVGVAGSACYDNGIFELQGSGSDIWDVQDGFRFAYKTFVGDVEIVARVASLDNSDPWNKCGIMIREDLTAGSRHVFIALTSGNGIALQDRPQADGVSYNVSVAGLTAPYWIKMIKLGSVYTAYSSANGSDWSPVGGPIDAGFGDNTPVNVGLALTSHNNGLLSVATIDNYLLSPMLPSLSLTADATLSKTVALQWVATLETSVQAFVVERSMNDIQYSELITVPAVSNGKYTQTYQFEDKQPLEGINYYRLRLKNLDGSSGYSITVFAFVSSTSAPLLYPNPVTKGIVNIQQGQDAIITVTIYDLNGRVMNRFNNTSGFVVVEIPVATFSNGIYIMEIKTATSVFRQRLAIQN